MKILKTFILLLLTHCLAASAAEPSPQFAADHLAAAERVVYAMALPERFIIPASEMIKLSKQRDPVNAGLMGTTFNPYLEKKYTAEKLKPFFASRFDLEACRQIAAFWEGPVGKKLVRIQLRLLTTGKAERPAYNRGEKAILKKFENSDAGQAMLQAMPDIEDVFAEYTKDTQTKMREEFLRELERRLKNGTQAGITPAPKE